MVFGKNLCLHTAITRMALGTMQDYGFILKRCLFHFLVKIYRFAEYNQTSLFAALQIDKQIPNFKTVIFFDLNCKSVQLLCRTLPAGYMELGESAAEGAARETLEEAQADVEVVGHFAHLDIPLIGQVSILSRALKLCFDCVSTIL